MNFISSIKLKGTGDYDYGICGNDWSILRVDDTDMSLLI